MAEHLNGTRAEILAFTDFPKAIWRQIWSNNPKNGPTAVAAPTSSASSSTGKP